MWHVTPAKKQTDFRHLSYVLIWCLCFLISCCWRTVILHTYSRTRTCHFSSVHYLHMCKVYWAGSSFPAPKGVERSHSTAWHRSQWKNLSLVQIEGYRLWKHFFWRNIVLKKRFDYLDGELNIYQCSMLEFSQICVPYSKVPLPYKYHDPWSWYWNGGAC